MSKLSKYTSETDIVRAYQSGESLLHIASKSGHPAPVVRYIVARNNVSIRPRGRQPGSTVTENRDEEILKHFDSGKKLQEIGDIFGITRERVRQIAAKYKRAPRNVVRRAVRAKVEQRQKDEAEFRKLARAVRLKTAQLLWLSGANSKTVASAYRGREVSWSHASSTLHYLRTENPGMFPLRQENHWKHQLRLQKAA